MNFPFNALNASAIIWVCKSLLGAIKSHTCSHEISCITLLAVENVGTDVPFKLTQFYNKQPSTAQPSAVSAPARDLRGVVVGGTLEIFHRKQIVYFVIVLFFNGWNWLGKIILKIWKNTFIITLKHSLWQIMAAYRDEQAPASCCLSSVTKSFKYESSPNTIYLFYLQLYNWLKYRFCISFQQTYTS